MKKTWERMPVRGGIFGTSGGNFILTNEDVLVSYQPWDRADDYVFNDIVSAMTGDDSHRVPETALHNELTGEWLILKGDHRKAYEKAFPSLSECLKVYESLKDEYAYDKWTVTKEDKQMKEGTRVKGQHNGAWVRGTIDADGLLVSDTDGYKCHTDNITNLTELKGIEAVRVGDIIVHKHNNEAKVLETGQTSFLISFWDDFEYANEWLTYAEAKECGYKIKGQEEEVVELTLQEIADKHGIPVEKLRVKE